MPGFQTKALVVMSINRDKLVRLVNVRTKCYIVVTAYIHDFAAYLKFVNREFH